MGFGTGTCVARHFTLPVLSLVVSYSHVVSCPNYLASFFVLKVRVMVRVRLRVGVRVRVRVRVGVRVRVRVRKGKGNPLHLSLFLYHHLMYGYK